MSLRRAVGVAFILAQLGSIAYARFVPTRYFCWAPFDALATYQLSVVRADGTALTPAEIRARYHRSAKGLEQRAIQHLMDIISQYERTYGRADGIRATLTYRVNGSEERTWQWP